MSADSTRRLGRGLEALISTARQQRDVSISRPDESTGSNADLQRIHIADISPNRFQPRRNFTETELAELEASIKVNGLLQPIVVRPQSGSGWELVAGERRLRAATRIGWTEIPATVRNFDDRAMLTLALVENLQRADLNPLEEAEGYERLIDEFGLTQQQVAAAVGKDRTTITNLLRVLSLPVPIRQMVELGQLTAGHARALLPIKDERRQLELANESVARQFSVREVEAYARARSGAEGSRSDSPVRSTGLARPLADLPADPATRRVEEQLRKHLQTDVHVQQHAKDRGVVRISYYSADDLDRLLDLVLGQSRSDFD